MQLNNKLITIKVRLSVPTKKNNNNLAKQGEAWISIDPFYTNNVDGWMDGSVTCSPLIMCLSSLLDDDDQQQLQHCPKPAGLWWW